MNILNSYTGLIEGYLPYLVVLGVIILFLIICYWLFKEKKHESDDPFEVPSEEIHTGDYYRSSRRKDEPILPPIKEPESVVLPFKQESVEDTVATRVENPASETMAIAIDPNEIDAGKKADADSTMVIPKTVEGPDKEAIDADVTRIIPVVKEDVKDDEPISYSRAIPKRGDEFTENALERATAQYMAAFGVTNPKSKVLVEEITEYAFRYAGIHTEQELSQLLENVVIDEALLAMQKAYVATPTDWMRDMAVEAFKDVVQTPKSSTHHLVAFDSIKLLARLNLGQVQAMAITLLLQYSRNSNNYSLESFRHYVEKYIEPFLSDLPKQEGPYSQLDYMHCISRLDEPTSLVTLFKNSYPLVFNYRGFSHEELDVVLDGERLKMPIAVPSMNSNLLKLAIVDESMAPRLFRKAGIFQSAKQERILKLAISKPMAFEGQASYDVLESISPVLLDFAELYERLPLASMSLTLIGLYLARCHVKSVIGEEFDLRPWLS